MPKPLRQERLALLLLLAITALGGALRFYQIGRLGLWLDEAFSVWLGRQPLTEMWGWLLRIDQHPPLYYTLLHFWMAFGDSEGAVRSLSALAGMLTIPAIYLLGRRLGGAAVGLLAALLLALSPFHVYFAQETRMYTLLTLNATLALLALAYLLTAPRPALAWAGYMFFTAATVYSHNTAILFPVAVNLFVVPLILLTQIANRKSQIAITPPPLRHWLLAQLGAFLLWSPWLGGYVIQAMRVDGEFWILPPTVGTVLDAAKSFLSAFLPPQIGWAAVIWMVYGLAAVLGCVRFRKQPAALALLFVLMLVAPAGELLVSLRRPIFYDKTLIWTTIPLFILLAAGLSQLRYRPAILAGAAILATVNGLSLREYYTHFTKEQWNDAASYVAGQVQAQDVILFNATWVQIPFDYYFRAYHHPVSEHGLPVDLFDRGILEPKMAAEDLPHLHALIRGRQRVWLIYSHNWYTDPHNLIPAALAEELKLIEQRRFVGLEVLLYDDAQ